MTDLIGHTLGQYQILQEIGHGGMANVYRAVQTSIGREVAIKVLPAHFLQDRTFLERFTREVKIIARLKHPRILPVFDFGEQDGMPYIAMTYMEGGTLADRIHQAGNKLPLDEIARLVDQITEGLDYAHEKGIVHRDFKPSNVLLDEKGNVYLSDFGIAKVTEATAQLTGSGIVGTPGYMAPEMSSPGGATPLVDVYALGVTLYQMLTGRLPYEADTPMGILMAHLGKPIPDAHQLRPNLPNAVQRVIERAMAKDPAERYQSAGELAADLSAAVTTPDAAFQPTEHMPPTPPEVPTMDLPYSKPAPAAHPPSGTIPAPAPVPFSAPIQPPMPRPAPWPERRPGVPTWAWLVGGVIVGVMLVGAVAGGIAILAALKGSATPAPFSEATEVVVATAEATVEPTLPPTTLYGVQYSLDPATLNGWELCWSGTYDQSASLDGVLGNCWGSWLMMACRPTGDYYLSVAAMGPREDVLYEMGSDQFGLHESNGVGWYFDGDYSWGFVPAGDSVNRYSCDTESGSGHLCWHTGGNALQGGYRCGDNTDGDSSWERLVYHMSGQAAGGQAARPTFLSGVQFSLDPSSLDGWQECYSGLYQDSVSLSNVLSTCSGSWLLLGCRPAGEYYLTVAAMGPREDVLYDTGGGTYNVHQANGVGWYFSEGWSWGFAAEGDSVSLNNCDTENGSARLCWHTESGNMYGGYRCGSTIELNGSTDWERVIYQTAPGALAPADLPTPVAATAEATAEPVLPPTILYGVQYDVDPGILSGWEACWSGTYDQSTSLDTILNNCWGSWLMMACRPIGDYYLSVAAMGPREDVLYDVGQDQTGLHESNGVGWYFDESYSWGFTDAGYSVSRNECDTSDGSNRLCWHTSGGSVTGGWRCGGQTDLNASADWERVLYHLVSP